VALSSFGLVQEKASAIRMMATGMNAIRSL